MKMSGQFLPPVAIGWKVGWAQEPAWTLWRSEKKKNLLCWKTNRGLPALSPSLFRLSYPDTLANRSSVIIIIGLCDVKFARK
jgi:hypothetical protein